MKLEFSTRFHFCLTKSAGGAGLNGERIAVIRPKIARIQRGKVQDKEPAFQGAGGEELADGSWKWCVQDSSQRAARERQELNCMQGTPAEFLFGPIAALFSYYDLIFDSSLILCGGQIG